ncbi:MAG: DUF3047 domain-containing protein [Nitrospirota bacterium]
MKQMTVRIGRVTGLTIVGVAFLVCAFSVPVPVQSAGLLVLDDYSAKDTDGFPTAWKAQRQETKARKQYTVQSEKGMTFLAAKGADQRVYKRIAWDPKAMPIVTWRWRVKKAPAGADPVAAVFVSLDTDLLVIPVATKYVWSQTKEVGTMTEGGLFDASEIVLQQGPRGFGEWVEQRVNAYEDFKRIHRHEPAAQAWGISLQGGPDVEVDFGPMIVTAP